MKNLETPEKTRRVGRYVIHGIKLTLCSLLSEIDIAAVTH